MITNDVSDYISLVVRIAHIILQYFTYQEPKQKKDWSFSSM
jgi:hypothetical protein